MLRILILSFLLIGTSFAKTESEGLSFKVSDTENIKDKILWGIFDNEKKGFQSKKESQF